jgi:hypothetical protein
VAYGAIQFQNTGASPAPDSCSWIVTGQGVNRLDGVGPMATVPASGFASTANSSVIDVSGPGTFTLGLFCGVNGSLTPTGQMTVTAVGTLH